MNPDEKQRGLFDSVLADAASPGYGPNVSPTSVAEFVTRPIDNAMTRLRLYGKGSASLPHPTMMQVEDAVGNGAARMGRGAMRLIERYGTPGAPVAPAPPRAPSYVSDPEDRGKSMGVASMKPGGYY